MKKEKQPELTNNLQSGIENLSGYSMDDVKVHYNSSKPNDLDANEFSQGEQIHANPGHPKHLTHEASHVVQQRQRKKRSEKPDAQILSLYKKVFRV